jgi:6-phosphogluconolactonase (cycloisomerase 2 family)
MSTAIIKDFVTNNGLEVEESITLGDKTVTSLVDSSTVNAIVTSPSVASSIVVAGGASTKTYDSADLLPLSGNTSGELAYVNANNRLYLWNGVGWYGIALINTSPTFDSGGSPESSYTLDSNGGTATTITLNATDPEGATIQYSYLSSDASTFATISQSNNVFTVTALSDSALDSNGYAFGGTFDITFRASDGVNIVPAVSNFTLTINVNYEWSTSSQQGSRFTTAQTSGAPFFGKDVGISRDGNTVIVGAKGETLQANGSAGNSKGTASVYTRSGTTWSFEQRIVAPSYSSSADQFGTAVAISGDGTIAAIGAPFKQKTGTTQNTGAFQVWKKTGSTWAFSGEFFPPVDPYATTEPDHWFGYSLAVDATGQRIAVGVPKKDKNDSPTRTDCGAVWVYKNNGDKFYDLSSASSTGTKYVGSQDNQPMGHEFNNNGTKMYITGGTTDSIYQYSLSTAYDVTTATYDNVSLDISATNPYPTCLKFNNDGTKLWVVSPNTLAGTSESIYEYGLTTAYDLSTASYSNVNLNLSAQESRPHGIDFKPDGTKMFMTGWSNDRVYQYSLSSAWDITTASYDNVNFSVSSQDGTPRGITLNGDGTKIFIAGDNSNTIYQYSLSTAYDISTMSYDSVSFSVNNYESSPFQISFSSTGHKLFVIGSSGQAIDQFSTQGLDLQQEAIIYADDASSGEMLLGWDVAITPDGDRIVAGAENRDITGGTRGGAVYIFDRSGTTWSQFGSYIEPGDPNTDDDFGSSVDITSDGNTVVVGSPREDTAGTDAGAAYVFTSGNIVDFTTATLDHSQSAQSSLDQSMNAMLFNSDGTKMYMCGGQGDKIYTYDLTTAYDVSTATYDNSVDITLSDLVVSGNTSVNPAHMRYNNNGTKLFILNQSQDRLHEYALSSAYDISTLSHTGYHTFLTTSIDPWGFDFNNDGTKIVVVSRSDDRIYSYNLSTAYDVSTISTEQSNFYLGSNANDPFGVAFSNDGKKMFVTNTDTWASVSSIKTFNLSTAYDITTIVYSSSTSLTSGNLNISEGQPKQITFNSDYTKAYLVGNASDNVSRFSVGSVGWTQQAKLTASDAASSANYGISVAIDEQGTVVMVGSHKINSAKGEVYVYQRTGESWSTATERKKLTTLTSDLTSSDEFGVSIALSRGGGTVVVGAQEVNVVSSTQAGAIYIFTGTKT